MLSCNGWTIVRLAKMRLCRIEFDVDILTQQRIPLQYDEENNDKETTDYDIEVIERYLWDFEILCRSTPQDEYNKIIGNALSIKF